MCAVYFCGIQNVYELQKLLAHDVNKNQERQNRLTASTSAMVFTKLRTASPFGSQGSHSVAPLRIAVKRENSRRVFVKGAP